MTLEAGWLLGTVVAGGLLVELGTRLLARVHPSSYFGMSELFVAGLGRDLSWRGFVVRLAIPFFFGALVSLLNPGAGSSAGAAAGGLGALLAVWPPLVYDHLLPRTAWGREKEIRVVYVLYIISYLLLGLAGGGLAGLAAAEFAPTAVADWFAGVEVPTSTTILGGLIVFGIGTVLLHLVERLRRRFYDGSE